MTPPNIDPHRCYRPDELATMLRVSTRTIYRMISRINDPLPAIRISTGGPLRIWGHAITTYLANHEVKPEYE